MTKYTPTNNGTGRPIYVGVLQFKPVRRWNDQKLNNFAVITRDEQSEGCSAVGDMC